MRTAAKAAASPRQGEVAGVKVVVKTRGEATQRGNRADMGFRGRLKPRAETRRRRMRSPVTAAVNSCGGTQRPGDRHQRSDASAQDELSPG
mmetsp:Transcript_119126/g.273217  ORF Transcript_119126/g.273217 Transcript_119126/m.273217 type:complete len:91 (-) Transcript_119126:46-318(-)